MADRADACRDTYRDLLRAARRCVRSADEAHDLAQDALTVALARGLEDWSTPARRAWLRGVVRKRAAFLARSHARRRRREQLHQVAEAGPGGWTWQRTFLASLPQSLRVVAALASADLCGSEIRWLLGLTDTALRRRLSDLRRAVRAQPELPVAPAPAPGVALGAHRALLRDSARRQPARAFATHDPDGHPLLLRVVAHGSPPSGNRG